jgi:hypothetical protein
MQITVLKRKESFILLYWALSQILDLSAPELNFLTAARSRVRIDVSAEIVILKFSWWIQG